eukprot:5123281-Prymnesium_polylepis.1
MAAVRATTAARTASASGSRISWPSSRERKRFLVMVLRPPALDGPAPSAAASPSSFSRSCERCARTHKRALTLREGAV